MKDIKITSLRCGSMSVRPYDAFKADGSLLAKRIELPVNAYLIEHPAHGNILLDTGWSADIGSLLPRHLKDFYRPSIRPDETAKAQLDKIRYSAGRYRPRAPEPS